MKRILTLLLFLAMPAIITARAVRAWSYQEMFDQADLVVIAKPTATKDTEEKGRVADFSRPYEVIAVATELEASVIMKGEKATTPFVLHHYGLAKPDGPVVNGPNFVAFDPKAHHSFLLFLKKEADGRYAPVTGQQDPALFSVVRLEGVAR